MGALWQDILYGLRVLAKRPVFTAVAALSLALGIGLNTAIFSLTNTILLGPLPYRDPDRLLTIFSVAPEHLDQLNGVSVPDLFAWKEQARSFEAIGALANNASDFGAEENGMPAERVQGENVTPSLLQALGVQPFMGRLLTEADDEVDHPAPVILLSYRLWMRRFGGSQDVLNRKILVNGQNTSVIGVMPPDFRITDESGDWIAPHSPQPFSTSRIGAVPVMCRQTEARRHVEAGAERNGRYFRAACQAISRARYGSREALDRPPENLPGRHVWILQPSIDAVTRGGWIRVVDRVRECGGAAAGSCLVATD